MKNALKILLDRFMEGGRTNPPPKEEMDDFLQQLSENGQLFNYSEQDWVEAGKSVGLSDNEISNWIETAASWIDDTTEEGKYDPEPSAWAK